MNPAKTPFDYVYFSQEFGTVGVDKQIRAVFFWELYISPIRSSGFSPLGWT